MESVLKRFFELFYKVKYTDTHKIIRILCIRIKIRTKNVENNEIVISEIPENIQKPSFTNVVPYGRNIAKMNLFIPDIKYIGKNSYSAPDLKIFNENTKIGAFCSIGENVRIGHGEHPLNYLSTSPYFYYDNLGWKTDEIPSHNEFWDYKPVIIGNDVWIGDNVLIKNGITIGDGAIIGLGAVVTKDVPPYAIVAGVPAKIIKYRFDKETIDKLLKLKWWNLDDEILKKVPYDDINKAIDYIERFIND